MNHKTEKIERQKPSFSYQLEGDVLYLRHDFVLLTLDQYLPNLLRLIEKRPRKFLTIDLSGVNQIDSAGVIALQHLQLVARRNNIRVKLSGISSKIQQVIDSFSDVEQREPSIPQKTRILERIGGKVYFFLQESLPAFMFLLADITVWTVKDLFRSKAHRKGEFINQAILIGVNAVPLVMLITFLVGLVLALQSAQQLRQFGANVFVADLTVIAMTREMGPLLTAIMIAGRSGSAIASEIATMVVTEEVDALKSMALNPTRYVVIPKMHASLFTLPLLTVIADIFGILGGVLIAYLYLDVSPTIFYNRMVEVLFFKDILTGIIKSIIFAAAIVLTGSFYGFRARGGSESVGRATTQAVVTAIFLVILTDSILGLILY